MSNEPVAAHSIILLVEDSLADVRLTQEAFRDRKLIKCMMVAPDGIEALAILRKQGRYADAPRPDLVLLDLNLPRKNGWSVLEEIKKDADLRRIPVVVMTSSSATQDLVRSYDLHANCYVTKPIDLQSFMRVVRSVEEFWLGIVRLPPN